MWYRLKAGGMENFRDTLHMENEWRVEGEGRQNQWAMRKVNLNFKLVPERVAPKCVAPLEIKMSGRRREVVGRT